MARRFRVRRVRTLILESCLHPIVKQRPFARKSRATIRPDSSGRMKNVVRQGAAIILPAGPAGLTAAIGPWRNLLPCGLRVLRTVRLFGYASAKIVPDEEGGAAVTNGNAEHETQIPDCFHSSFRTREACRPPHSSLAVHCCAEAA